MKKYYTENVERKTRIYNMDNEIYESLKGDLKDYWLDPPKWEQNFVFYTTPLANRWRRLAKKYKEKRMSLKSFPEVKINNKQYLNLIKYHNSMVVPWLQWNFFRFDLGTIPKSHKIPWQKLRIPNTPWEFPTYFVIYDGKMNHSILIQDWNVNLRVEEVISILKIPIFRNPLWIDPVTRDRLDIMSQNKKREQISCRASRKYSLSFVKQSKLSFKRQLNKKIKKQDVL